MQTIVTLAEMKDWLNRAVDDTSFDSKITSLLLAAHERAQNTTGFQLIFADSDNLPDVPEQIKIAIKFLCATWFENPVADSKEGQDATQLVWDRLLARYRAVQC